MAKRRPKLKAGHSFECRQHLVSWWFVSLATTTLLLVDSTAECTFIRRTSNAINAQQSVEQQHEQHSRATDPMEPCYLANNRASESLTISESTPIGTIVGEIMVNGDSSEDGNIELSIRMPGGGNQLAGTQRQQAKTNGHYSSPSSLSQRIGSSAAVQNDTATSASTTTSNKPTNKAANPKTARDLSNLIDLMPPLSIEQGTKRLILTKRLDRENLDKYIQAGGGGLQSSSINSLSLTSSASLTVHIKCQLRDKQSPPVAEETNSTSTKNNTASVHRSTATKVSKDANSNSNSIIIPVHLIVTDENDNWPTFIASPYIIDLNESAPVGSLLQANEIVAYDNDQQGPLSTIEYSIVAGSYWSDAFAFLNPLDSRSLVVKSNRLLDFESQPKLMLKVMASDQGDPPNWAIASLYINLLDQDDLNPTFNEDKYHGFVKENRPGELIELAPKRMIARDGDKSLNAPIAYSFHMKTNQSIHFELDPDLGRLTLKKTLPEIRREPFCLLVRATQVDNARRWTLVMVNIQSPPSALTHIEHHANNNSTAEATTVGSDSFRFSQSKYTVEISEAAAIGSTVLTLRINHQFNGVTYQLLDNELGYLDLDEHSGRLTVNRSLDYEMHRQISVRILATYEQYDNAASSLNFPTLFCDTTRVNIEVTNFNEFTPEFSHEQYNFQLSVSELIANFEPPPKEELISADTSGSDASDEKRFDLLKNKQFAKRFGTSEFDHSNDEPADEFSYRALRLGQIFCADRDSSDKITLHLSGSKANMFYLTQDGQLFLPLVNVSGNLGASEEKLSRRSDTESAINNQFVFSRLFAPAMSRRSSPTSDDTKSLDRNYLNYLLSEFNNLGRLRLKVTARDDGQPEAKQSTALIVITIISIENFILQRAPPPPASPYVPSGFASATNSKRRDFESVELLSNETTSYDSGGAKQETVAEQQVMMIPSTNGKSFVQVNSDIITNLLAPNKLQHQENSTTRDPQQKYYQFENNRLSFESLESAASNNNNVVVATNETSQVGKSPPFKPPSLLLIDDDGAKFVAMPAAIEVYNQQVQAGQQLARTNRNNQLASKANRQQATESANWFSWLKDRLGLNQHWPSLATAILIQVVIVVVIVSLMTRFTFSASSLFSGSSDHLHQEHGQHPSSDHFNDANTKVWRRKLPRFSLPFSNNSNSNIRHANFNGTPPIVSMLNDSSSSLHADVSHMISNRSASGGGGSTMANSNDNLEGHSGFRTRQKQQPTATSPSNGTMIASEQSAKQQNLLNHLKSTISKMLDLGQQEGKSSCIGQVTVKPLDCEIYENRRDMSAFNQPVVVSAESTGKSTSPLSTFVGSTTNNPKQPNRSNEEKCYQNKTIVSINITSPPNQDPAVETSTRQTQKQHNHRLHSFKTNNNNNSSSSSSVISLVSMSSSISNKISAAVGMSANGHRTTASTSDASSIDSSTLFNRIDGLAVASPPKPPPLPPPPSLIQVRFDGIASTSSSPTKAAAKSPTVNNKKPVKLSHPHNQNRSHSSSPRVNQQSSAASSSTNHLSSKQQPQNPAHVKLRQEALAEKVNCTNNSSQSPAGQRYNPSTGRLFDRKYGGQSTSSTPSKATPVTSTGGRREARQALERTLPLAPPTPPPMPPPVASKPMLNHFKGINGNLITTKTVSPTTSVDRGYESFQSYNSSSQFQQQHRLQTARAEANQFSSLQEYDVDCRENCTLPTSSDHRNHAGISLDQEDFYYCCKNVTGGAKINEGEGDDANLMTVGNLLSDYASHTYRQQQHQSDDHRYSAPSKQRKQSTNQVRAKRKYSQQHQVDNSEQDQNLVPSSTSFLYNQTNEQAGDPYAHQFTNRRIQSLARRGRVATNRQLFGAAAAAATTTSNKKQLTWSDQVETNY